MSSAGIVVVALMGLPGAGKTTIARALLQHFPLHLLDRDAVRAAMFPACQFSGQEKDAANDALAGALTANCQLGRHTLIDGMTFATVPARERFALLSQAANAVFLPLHIDCPPAIASARVTSDLQARRHAALDRDAALVDRIAAHFAPLPGATLSVCSVGDPSDVCAAAVEQLRPYLPATLLPE